MPYSVQPSRELQAPLAKVLIKTDDSIFRLLGQNRLTISLCLMNTVVSRPSPIGRPKVTSRRQWLPRKTLTIRSVEKNIVAPPIRE